MNSLNLIKAVIISMVFIMVLSCTTDTKKNYEIVDVNGIKVFKNKNKPSVDKLEINPVELFTINGTEEYNGDSTSIFLSPAKIDIDSKGNIYILDFRTSSVKKFDRNGKFVKSFGQKGLGPGEMGRTEYMMIINDTIFVNDLQAARMVKFDAEGNFINNIPISTDSRQKNMSAINAERFVANLESYSNKEDGFYLIYNLVITDSKFQELKKIRFFEMKLDNDNFNRLDTYDPYAFGDGKIFFSENSEDKYLIKVFDYDGNHLYSIEKSYRRQSFSSKERSAFDSLFAKSGRGTPPLKALHKKVINSMYYDKHGRLLVASSRERNEKNKYDFNVDVFKDGIFLKTTNLGIFDSYDFLNFENRLYFKDNRIFYFNSSEAFIKVYDY